jgi:uncharacterized protein (DUF302 family)
MIGAQRLQCLYIRRLRKSLVSLCSIFNEHPINKNQIKIFRKIEHENKESTDVGFWRKRKDKITAGRKVFTLFSDIDHQANAASVYLELPASRVLIFGNPVAGTNLMQKDITMSFDLPSRIAIVERDGETLVLHETPESYAVRYQVHKYPVLAKVDELFSFLTSELSAS